MNPLPGPRGRDQHGAAPASPLGHRLLWFAALWLAGVLAVALVGLAIKLLLRG